MSFMVENVHVDGADEKDEKSKKWGKKGKVDRNSVNRGELNTRCWLVEQHQHTTNTHTLSSLVSQQWLKQVKKVKNTEIGLCVVYAAKNEEWE